MKTGSVDADPLPHEHANREDGDIESRNARRQPGNRKAQASPSLTARNDNGQDFSTNGTIVDCPDEHDGCAPAGRKLP